MYVDDLKLTQIVEMEMDEIEEEYNQWLDWIEKEREV